MLQFAFKSKFGHSNNNVIIVPNIWTNFVAYRYFSLNQKLYPNGAIEKNVSQFYGIFWVSHLVDAKPVS